MDEVTELGQFKQQRKKRSQEIKELISIRQKRVEKEEIATKRQRNHFIDEYGKTGTEAYGQCYRDLRAKIIVKMENESMKTT